MSLIDKIKIKVPQFSTFDQSHNLLTTSQIGDINVEDYDILAPKEKIHYRSNLLAKFSALMTSAFAHMKIKEYAFFVPFTQISDHSQEFFMNIKQESTSKVENGTKHTENYKYADYIPLNKLVAYIQSTSHSALSRSTGDNYQDFRQDCLGYRLAVGRLCEQMGIPKPFTVPCCSDDYGIPIDYNNVRPQFKALWNNLKTSIDWTSITTQNYGTQTGQAGARGMKLTSSALPVDLMPFRAYQHIYNTYFRDSRVQDSIDIYPSVHGGNYSQFMGDNSAACRFYNNLFMIRKKNFAKDYFNTAATDPTLGSASVQVPQTIVGLRKANKMQSVLEKKALSGSRYADYLLAYFGANANEYETDRPIFLGSSSQTVGVGEVLQTSESTEDGKLGQRGGTANAYGTNKGFTFTAPDYGIFMVLYVIEPEIAYFNGIPRKLIKSTFEDYPLPEFSQIGMQPIHSEEFLMPLGDSTFGINTFGYAPRYSEYKIAQNRIQGEFTSNLNYWHQSPNFLLDVENANRMWTINHDFPVIGQQNPLDWSYSVQAHLEYETADPYYNQIFSITSDEVADHCYLSFFIDKKIRRCLPYDDMPHL